MGPPDKPGDDSLGALGNGHAGPSNPWTESACGPERLKDDAGGVAAARAHPRRRYALVQVHTIPDFLAERYGGNIVRSIGVIAAIVCSFVPRVVDFHPDAIPCPYPHSSVDCDEILFYVSGNFTSRRGVGPGSVSFHPAGIPHGPHPGAYEASIGHKATNELAVMVDTFRPLKVAKQALDIEDPAYHKSWLDAQHAAFNPPTS